MSNSIACLQELSADEYQDINGGGWFSFASVCSAAVAGLAGLATVVCAPAMVTTYIAVAVAYTADAVICAAADCITGY